MSNRNIGAKIRNLLYLKNMSQAELADKLGIRRQTLSVWLTSRRIPKLSTIEKIAKALDVPISEINDITEKDSATKDMQLQIKDHEIRLLKIEKQIMKLEKENLEMKVKTATTIRN